jgi:hypothetical protein
MVFLGGACTTAGSTLHVSATPTGSAAGTSNASTIPQPPLGGLNQRTRQRLAPESQRVDLAVPTFTHPTDITNPLFPIGDLRSVVLVGNLHGRPWRAETTLLPDPVTVDWNGQQIQALRSQFIAFLDGRIFEVAVDHYAQADDGSVWYLGEDAYTYTEGDVSDTEGTWLAGVNGPPAMIMPGDPQVGQVYRTENIPGVVFEQVTVKKVDQTVDGPTGAVHGAMVGQELHMDEKRLEDKVFAPGYGEFFSGGGRTYESTALAVPVDALSQPPPSELERLMTDSTAVVDAAGSDDWRSIMSSVHDIAGAWSALAAGDVPPGLATEMKGSFAAVQRSVRARDSRETALRAIDLARADLDLQLRYRSEAEVDTMRFDLWTRTLQVDAESRDQATVEGDVATLDWIRDRLALTGDQATRVDDELSVLAGEARSGELAAASEAAALLRETLAVP